MLEIILVRHGETEWNASETFRGRADVALNDTGLRQAKRLGEYLGGVDLDVIYSSPLLRARQTAEAIVAYQWGIQVNIISNLIDLDYGEWQGLTHDEVRERDPELYQDWKDTPEQVGMPGGESLEDVICRVMPFVQDAITRCVEGRMVLVSHRVVNKVLICAMLGLNNASFWNVRLDTGALTIFYYEDGRFILTRHNDASYLGDARREPLADF